MRRGEKYEKRGVLTCREEGTLRPYTFEFFPDVVVSFSSKIISTNLWKV